ncbi:unnamed protein product [Strongylus vulgaris]|uniref:SH2 domain-containing protein n=1 Tax=Strongylus vulgaris TaxID=40348 RepID=A0A3P7JAG3_STRVU|nr:unnamed protein product [Strongylus vulgaris]
MDGQELMRRNLKRHETPEKELLVRNLLSQCEGAFVVRYSESKRRCLALSVRVPPTHNPACISHYLIIRNQNGYRIKVR